MGISGRPECIGRRLALAENEMTAAFTRVKAIEALGRLRGTAATTLLIHLMDARQLWRWQYPEELRIAYAQALMRIDANTGLDKLAPCGFDRKDLVLEPADPDPNVSLIRQRRYARLKLNRNLIATTLNMRENFRLSIPELNLGGGVGSGERHLAPGSLLSFRIPHGVRSTTTHSTVRRTPPQPT